MRNELQKIIAKKVTRPEVNVTSKDGERKFLPNRHQVVKITVYSERVYGLLDSGAIPNVMSDTLAEKLRLKLARRRSALL